MKHLLIAALTALTTIAIAGNAPQPSRVAETVQEAMQLRQLVTDFYAAPNIDAVRTIRDRWQNMPEEMRGRIENRHPGTNLRILMLDSEIPAPATKPEPVKQDAVIVPSAATVPPPTSTTVSSQDIWKSSSTTESPPTETKDQWAHTDKTVAKPTTSKATNAPLIYDDELDIFGNRPKPKLKR